MHLYRSGTDPLPCQANSVQSHWNLYPALIPWSVESLFSFVDLRNKLVLFSMRHEELASSAYRCFLSRKQANPSAPNIPQNTWNK